MRDDLYIRWMIRRDLEPVLEIESVQPYPWAETDFINALRKRNSIGMVADIVPDGEEHNGCVVYPLAAFIVCEREKNLLAVRNFAVAIDQRRTGVGSQMIDKIKGKLSQQRRSLLLMDVREDNLAGQLFLRANGFKAKIIHDDAESYRFEYRPPVLTRRSSDA